MPKANHVLPSVANIDSSGLALPKKCVAIAVALNGKEHEFGVGLDGVVRSQAGQLL